MSARHPVSGTHFEVEAADLLHQHGATQALARVQRLQMAEPRHWYYWRSVEAEILRLSRLDDHEQSLDNCQR